MLCIQTREKKTLFRLVNDWNTKEWWSCAREWDWDWLYNLNFEIWKRKKITLKRCSPSHSLVCRMSACVCGYFDLGISPFLRFHFLFANIWIIIKFTKIQYTKHYLYWKHQNFYLKRVSSSLINFIVSFSLSLARSLFFALSSVLLLLCLLLFLFCLTTIAIHFV